MQPFSEAWERFKEMLRACPLHGFTELTQVDTFYNGLIENAQDSLNAAEAWKSFVEKRKRWRDKGLKSKPNFPEPDVPKTLPKTTPIPEPDVPKSLPKLNIPYPSRLNQEKFREKLHIKKFAPTIRNLLMNKEKLLELAKIMLNENCSAMLLKKLPGKLGDPGKFLIPCNFLGMDVCHALADLGAFSIWKKLSLPKLTPTRMTLELADRSITHPKGLAEDVYVKVGKFHFIPTLLLLILKPILEYLSYLGDPS
ncbi:hypothetical protein Tco_0570921 [Tanacetum coccineum]